METIDHVLGGLSFLFIVIGNVGFAKQRRWAFVTMLIANAFWIAQSYRIGNWTYLIGIVAFLCPLCVYGWFNHKETK